MNLPPDFWQNEKRRLLAILGPKMRQAAQAGAGQAASKLGIGLNLELANKDATRWAEAYTDELLNLLNTTSERFVGQAISEYMQNPEATMGDLVNALTPKLAGNRARADLIAVTEVTRAYANGEKAAYRQAGITKWRWNTRKDELVCPICSPLNKKVVDIGTPFGTDKKGRPITEPPGHPGCRCAVSPVVERRERLIPRTEEIYPTQSQTIPVPTALGADVHWRAKNQAIRHNELAEKTKEQLSRQLERLQTPNPIPKIEHHVNRHGAKLGITTTEEYQKAFEQHLKKDNLRYFTGVDHRGKRKWFLVDVENGRVSEYNEDKDIHFTFYLSKKISNFLNENQSWLVEVNKDSKEFSGLWKP